MSMGTPWQGGTSASTARKNKTSVITDTGDNLSVLNKTKYKIVTCNETGSGYEEDNVYYWSDDGSVEKNLTQIQDHTHNFSDGDGGSLITIWQGNPEIFDIYLSRPTDMIKANWNQTVSGTGSIEDGGGGTSKPYIRLRPNATSGSTASINYTNVQNLTFDEPSIFVTEGVFETASSLAFHAGVNIDFLSVADTNTRKYQAEVCTATNSNWWLRTANGTNTSTSDIGVAITTGDQSIKMVHNPNFGTPEVLLEIDAANAFTKTNHIPIDGNNTTGNLVGFSQKNSTAADRPYRMKGCRISFITDDAWGYG